MTDEELFKKIRHFKCPECSLQVLEPGTACKKTLEYYRKQVSKNQSLHGNSDIATALRKRILARGINPIPKKKGELHIFLAFALSIWERVSHLALQRFRKVIFLNAIFLDLVATHRTG